MKYTIIMNVMRTHNSDIIYSYSHIIIMYQKQLKLSQAFMPPSTEVTLVSNSLPFLEVM